MGGIEESLHAFLAAAPGRLTAGRLRRADRLAQYTTFRIGGPADALYDATSADDLANAVLLARETGTPYFVLGLGANVLIGDGGYRGVVIRNLARAHHFDGTTLRAESGCIMQHLIFESVHRGLSGLEHYVGIPSTVGGAVWQNLHFLAPAPGRERTVFVEEVVRHCELLGADGTRRLVGRADMGFGYDTSILHRGRDVALAVTFELAPGSEATMQRIMQENLSWRGARHPWLELYPSAGSIFRKIEGVGAGRLIDQCGLKGFRIGDAQISHIHANIIVNVGAASARDVRAVIAHAQAAVRARFGLHLEPEITFAGDFTD